MIETKLIYYLIHIDILGYNSFIEEISNDTGVEEREIRSTFHRVINEKILHLIEKKIILPDPFTGRDDWTLVTQNVDNLFLTISTIFDHYTPYNNYRKIPLEIAIGKGIYDKLAKLGGHELFHEKESVEIYGKNIIEYYHEYFHHQNRDKKIPSYIVLTKETYEDLEAVEKEHCNFIEVKNKKRAKITFYLADFKEFNSRGSYLTFLRKIGHAEDNKVRRVDTLYVPPTEYREMLQSLKLNRILFITGTQEFGKTFSAVNFLWEFYKNGYDPTWISGSEESERKEVRKKIENISSYVKPKTIIYFEDPFGKTVYERRESLERNIGAILEAINNVRDGFVVITSREEVFKEFKKKKISSNELEKFEKRLNVKYQSYDYQARRKMLINWAKEYHCIWLEKSNLVKMISNLMFYQDQLPTPLNIHDFSLASNRIDDPNSIETLLRIKSGETSKAFAKEIESMSIDKQVFLSFPLIGEFEIESVQTAYDRIIEGKKQTNTVKTSFKSMISWFDKDKISIYSSWQGKKIRFSHPSYAESLKYLLLDEHNERTLINEQVISIVILDFLKHTQNNSQLSQVINTMFRHFTAFPTECQDLIFQLAKKKRYQNEILIPLIENFPTVPENCKDLLFDFMKDGYTAGKIIDFLIKDYSSISPKYRKILFDMSENNKFQSIIAMKIFNHFRIMNSPISEECILLWRNIKKIRPLSEYGIR